ncbi:hypothetical protein ERO13_D13G110950v2 [Gossypium hirsutum]|uniref:Cupin type-1 domain-containing protein n=5 Tax=Gossypium TaxID=3633 RepID=A0A0D2U051_GOSRA|nr:hypothetical protein ES319_D13G127300v1 [Gossypium barbadense]KAG4111551.1 hypothetical protein ERO13_D13G110950v2 [Gossypium hirsutum]KJB80988.1 hypothetical protein B456_013G124400 [Gossypium raimondii]TYG37353.1 hypothetical protein ES288_D13G135000v1 [Gossypium darwinii]TYH34566.1 hypothetical protein ES332_D13G136000v1 [Gossypium tomentosum]TYI46812.1 hypothetical protein E1A91_D13G130400v1 [Gossypium mustelinum]
MGFLKQTSVFKISLLFTLFFISSTAQFAKIVPHFETLQRGLLPPSGGSPCTNIPGGSGTCVVNEINAAGHLLRSRPAFPGVHVIKAAGTTSMGE